MQNKPLRIIIDTNLWISFLITNNFSKLDEILVTQKSILIFSEELLEEFLLVVKRPKLKRYFRQEVVESLLEAIQEYAEFIDIKTQTSICRDPKDNFLLSLAIDGKADYLITGDKDLLDIERIKTTKITTIADFISSV